MLSRPYKSAELHVFSFAHQARALSEEIGDPTFDELHEELDLAMGNCRRERSILLLGAEGSGKSALLSAMIDEPVIASASTLSPYCCWHMSESSGKNNSTRPECQRYLVKEQLAGLQFVEGADIEATENRELLQELAPQADIILLVHNSKAEIGEGLWATMLHFQKNKLLPKCQLIITHTDELPAEKSIVLKESLRSSMQEKLGEAVPFYYIPAFANSPAIDTLRQVVQRGLESTGGIDKELKKITDVCSKLFQRQSLVLNGRESVHRSDNGFLAGIEEEINNFQQKQLEGAGQLSEFYVGEIYLLREQFIKQIRGSFSFIFQPSHLIELDRLSMSLEAVLYQLVNEQVLQQQVESDGHFIIACESHWNDVNPRMLNYLHCDIGAFHPEELQKELEKLRQQLSQTIYEVFLTEKLRHHFAQLFQPIVKMLYPYFIICCLVVATAGALGVMGMTSYAVMAMIAGVLLLLLTSVREKLAIRRASLEVNALTLQLCEQLKDPISKTLSEIILSRISAYRLYYVAPREKLTYQGEMLAPLREKHALLYRHFSAMLHHL